LIENLPVSTYFISSNSLAISLQNIHPRKPSQRKIGGGVFPIPASLVAAPRIFIF